LRVGLRAGVDEERLVVDRDRQTTCLQIVRELASLGTQVAAETLRDVLRSLDFDRDAPVIVRHVGSSLISRRGLAREVHAGGGAVRRGGGARARRAAAR